jgi:cobalt/nickel transport system permease protein
MTRVDDALSQFRTLDELAGRDTPAARLDPRVKLAATLAFVLVVASFKRHDLLRLAPLAAFPVCLAALGDVGLMPLLRRLVLAAPFVLAVAAVEPFLDRSPAMAAGPLVLSGGVVAFATIAAKLALSLGATLVLVATTGFDAVCAGARRLGAPRILVAQLALMYRYVFVLADEARRMRRAHDQRCVGRDSISPRVAGALLGQLLVRSLARAERIHLTMRCRGFDGELPLRRPLRVSRWDVAFGVATLVLLALTRALDLPGLLGAWLTGGRA